VTSIHHSWRLGAIRLDAHPIVDGSAQLLFTTEITFRCLDRDMSEQELNLIQFATRKVAESRASPTKVVGREFLYARLHSSLPHEFPN